MRRRAFTLIELLAVVAIMGIMVAAGVVSVFSGQGAARVKGATRDIFAAIRRARSTALVTGKPAIVSYSTGTEDGEPVAKVEIISATLFSDGVDPSRVQTLSGEPVKGLEDAAPTPSAPAADGEDGAESAEREGQSVEEILFSPIRTDVVRGMCLKVVKGDEVDAHAEVGRKPRLSVFSNVDFLIGRYNEAKSSSSAVKEAETSRGGEKPSAEEAFAGGDEATAEPVQVVWETNGRVEPHMVWVYARGRRPEDGLLIKVDRFGAAKVLSGDGREDGQ